MAIVAGLFPMLVKLKDENEALYLKRLQQIFDFLVFLAIGLGICTYFVAEPLIGNIWGSEYIQSAYVLQIHIWSSVFIFMRALFSRWIHIEEVFIFSLVTQAIGALFNVVLNYFLIPDYGSYGAAIATLISYGMASFVSLALHQKSRVVFYMMCKSLLVPLRAPKIMWDIRKIDNKI